MNRQKVEEELAKMDAFMQMRRRKYKTRKQYRHWLWRYAEFVDSDSAMRSLPTERKMEAFLSWLAVERKVAASTQNQAFSALLFYYRDFKKQTLGNVDALRASRPVHVRTSLPKESVIPVLADVQDLAGAPIQLILLLIYGCGLRLNEALNLRIKDVLIPNSQLVIRQPKHDHERVVPVPCCLMPAIKRQICAALLVWQSDSERGIAFAVPDGLGRKDKRLPFRKQWAFVFPSPRLMRHPDSREMVRWHVPDWMIQRQLGKASAKHELDGLLTSHVLRHSFATDFSGDVQVLQKILGHRDCNTTFGYRHPDPRAVRLPMDEWASSKFVQISADEPRRVMCLGARP